MKEWLIYKTKLAKLNREKVQIEKLYTKSLNELKAKHGDDSNEVSTEYSVMRAELAPIEYEISHLISWRLVHIANRLLIPTPRYGDKEFWEDLPPYLPSSLNVKGISTLREAIRIERRYRREPLLAYGSMIVGVIGAITGLMAILTN